MPIPGKSVNKLAFTLLSTLIAMLAVPVKSSIAAETVSIEQKAERFLFNEYSQTNPLARTKISIKPLSAALKQRHCNQPIAFEHKPGRASRANIKAVCQQPKWSIYISAIIEQWQPIAVTSRALSKGTILGDTDLYLKEFDVRRLNSPYYTDPGELIGRAVKRAVAANQIISPTLIKKRMLIHKGDLVYIEARKGAMTIRMSGVAQKGGALGEQIPVINNRSGKTVRGYVKSQGVVSVSGN